MTEERQKDAVLAPKHRPGEHSGSQACLGVSLLSIKLVSTRQRAGRQQKGGAGRVKPDQQPHGARRSANTLLPSAQAGRVRGAQPQ